MSNRQIRIDIIVPVYNALEDLKLCVNSLKKHLDFTKDRVIIVNDHSPDEKVLPYLRSIESKDFVIIDNEVNLGFSGSVNKGMTYSQSDVILLNSDTIVTAAWTDKIYACAYSNPFIGTVTPFSNSATICSLPKYCQDNAVDKSRVDSLARAVDRISLLQYPRIPVAHGFCMFIKREVIQKVGLFNADVFKRGYGEENDFCYRMEQYGYYNVICDNAFVYHKGTASFNTEDKLKLAAEHTKWLEEHYPQQMRNTHLYTLNDPNRYYRDLYPAFSAIQNGKKNILYLMHLDFKEGSDNPFGGVQIHVKDLCSDMVTDHNIFVLSREKNQLMLTVYVDDNEYVFLFEIYPQYSFQNLYCKEYSVIYGTILDAFEIDLVHIHHIMNMSLDIYNEAYSRNIPIITSLHDYYFVCPGLMMVNTKMQSCLGQNDIEECKKCLWATKNISTDTFILPDWRKNIQEALCKSTVIVAPSESVKRNYSLYYPEIKDNIIIIEHGLDRLDTGLIEQVITQPDKYEEPKYAIENSLSDKMENISGWAFIPDCDSRFSKTYIYVKQNNQVKYYLASSVRRCDVSDCFKSPLYSNSGFSATIPLELFKKGTLEYGVIVINKNREVRVSDPLEYLNKTNHNNNHNVAVIGGISQHKGSDLIFKLVNNMSSKNKVRWFLFGGIGDSRLKALPQSKLFKTGFYSREDLFGIVSNHNIEMICILSVAPETFCYTLTEALQAGIPVLVKDVGALGDRVRAMDCGWVVSENIGEKELVRTINSIFSNTEEYNRKLNNIKTLHLKSVHEMCDEYRAIMSKIYQEHRTVSEYDKKSIWTAYLRAGQPHHPEENANLVSELRGQLESKNNELNWIYNSYGWKAVMWFRSSRIPGKSIIKKMLISVYRLFKHK